MTKSSGIFSVLWLLFFFFTGLVTFFSLPEFLLCEDEIAWVAHYCSPTAVLRFAIPCHFDLESPGLQQPRLVMSNANDDNDDDSDEDYDSDED